MRLALVGALLLVVVGVAFYVVQQLGESREFQAITAALEAHQFESARDLADARLKRRPGDVETLLLAAQAARRAGDPATAARRLDAAQRTGQMSEAILFERNLLDLQAGQFGLASRYLEVAEANPDAPESPLILESLVAGSLLRMDLRFAQRCVDSWTARAKLATERIQAKIWTAEIALRRGDVDAAIENYRQAVEGAPDNDAARLRLADLLARTAPTESLKHLEILRPKRPLDRDILLCTARCQRALGEPELAEKTLDQILAKSPKDYDALLERGQLSLDMRQFDVAERRLTEVVRLHPARRDGNLTLARCLQLAGRDDEAQAYRDKVAQIDAALDARMRAVRETGRLDE